MNREVLSKWIVAIYNIGELNECLKMLNIEAEFETPEFPVIIYQGTNKKIKMSEIEQKNLDKLFGENFKTKTVWNFSSIKSGLAERMEQK